MASLAAFGLTASLPSSRSAALRRQALLASRVSAGSHAPQAGAAPGLPHSKGGGEEHRARHARASEKAVAGGHRGAKEEAHNRGQARAAPAPSAEHIMSRTRLKRRA
jgi:hypothetical protein